MTNKEASQKYRNKDPEKYRAYQRDYKARRYDNDDIRIGLLKTYLIES